MSEAVITPEFEIVPAEIGLDLAAKNSLELAFSGFFEAAAKWRDQAAAITDPKLARTARLELKNLRVAAEKKRKELKEDSLRMGKAIDGANNILLSIIVPIERGLEDIEKAEERRIAEELRQRAESRTAELRPFVDPALPFPAVGGMTQEQFEAVLADAKLLHQMKQEAAAKAEAERIEREAEAARERLRIAEENERLRKEAAEREERMKAEREAAAAKQREIEEEARKERLAEQARREVERQRVEAEKAAAEAKARAEREEAEAKAKAEREAREKIEAEAAALRREAEEKRKAEEKRQADEAAAKANAAKAPDREKLIAFADAVRALTPGEMKTAAGNQIVGEILDQVAKFAAWIEKKAATL
jgi:hypothetical protein